MHLELGSTAAAHLTHPLHAHHQNAKCWTADHALPQTLQALCCRVALGTCEVWKGFQGMACKDQGAVLGGVLKQGHVDSFHILVASPSKTS